MGYSKMICKILYFYYLIIIIILYVIKIKKGYIKLIIVL